MNKLRINFKTFMNLYTKCTAKPYSFLVIDVTLASDNPLRFMTIDDKIRDEKLEYDIQREAAKISALSFGKLDKYEYLTGEEILSSDQRRVVEQAKFTYSPLGKALEKQTRTIAGQHKKQIKAIEDHGKQLVESN